MKLMASGRWSVDEIRNEILAAVSEVRSVARNEDDEHRQHTANWLDEQFSGVTEPRELREASARALGLYGGMGSFSDVGTAASHRAVRRLADALHRGRSWFLHGA
jgi:hypothetical protein